MRGKVVNLCIGGMNIVLGFLLLVYTIYMPKEITEFTVQELTVKGNLLNAIYILLILVFLINLLQYRNNRDNGRMKTGYLFGFFTLIFFLIKEPAISLFPIISGIIVFLGTLKDTIVERDSTTGISIVALMIAAIMITMGATFFYKNIAQSIKNRANKDSQAYKSDYFRYITELDIQDAYINVKKDGKYGYINPNGDVVIDFKYDYASPFVNIMMYNKNFQVALVCQEGTSKVIMKNERVVMTYRSESADENYEAKVKELDDIYTNILRSRRKMSARNPKAK